MEHLDSSDHDFSLPEDKAPDLDRRAMGDHHPASRTGSNRVEWGLEDLATGDDVLRFIARLAWSSIVNAEQNLKRILTFQYRDFKLDRHDKSRISAAIQQLLKDGEITQNPVRKEQHPTQVTSVELSQLDDLNSVVDPTKLCVAYAMRIGLLSETNWKDAISTVLRRPSKRFVWTKPDSPVFFALTRGQRLDFENPAAVDTQNHFLSNAAELVGMIEAPVSHDIRRSAAADVFTLKSNTGDTDRVRRSLCHSTASMNAGMTDRYIGRSRDDLWKARLEADTEVDPFGVTFAGESFKKRKITTTDIDEHNRLRNV
ncbi:hypothetical protein OPT61_g6701 [Boeremia exigua]|uniref:Uncharacterized protein n=1 Tax=Boeremia exigua TaxID=749465 RepID=A0ACC2I625_9PLEO|nr:hypothetical protein OPT61_g6701 [Boeremia exigua]